MPKFDFDAFDADIATALGEQPRIPTAQEDVVGEGIGQVATSRVILREAPEYFRAMISPTPLDKPPSSLPANFRRS